MDYNSTKKELKITSGYNFENYVITDYLGFCTGECVLGTGFLSSLEAGISDLLGANSSSYEGKLGSAKQSAVNELCNNAKHLGANAIIGIDVDYTTFSSDIIGVIANGTAVRIEPLKTQIPSSLQVDVDNYNPDLSFRASTLYISSSNGEQAFSIILSGDPQGAVTAVSADIRLTTVFEDTFNFQNIGFVGFKEISNDASRMSSPAPCRIPTEIIPLVKSSQVIIRKYIADGKIINVDDNNLPWAQKRERDILEAASQGLNVEKYLANISSLSSAAEIMKHTQEVHEKYNCMHPELLKIVQSQANLERMYGNLKDSCIEEVRNYFSSENA
jgi:uncharacterized protein YbjQ (UPF0145 family)